MGIDYTKRGADRQAGPPVSQGKVTLTKTSPTVSLTKQGSAGGRLHVNLNWQARAAQTEQPRGLLKRLSAAAQPGIDLDLGLPVRADGRHQGRHSGVGAPVRPAGRSPVHPARR